MHHACHAFYHAGTPFYHSQHSQNFEDTRLSRLMSIKHDAQLSCKSLQCCTCGGEFRQRLDQGSSSGDSSFTFNILPETMEMLNCAPFDFQKMLHHFQKLLQFLRGMYERVIVLSSYVFLCEVVILNMIFETYIQM